MVSSRPLSAFAAKFAVQCGGCGKIAVLERDKLIRRVGDLSMNQVAHLLSCKGCKVPPVEIRNSPECDGWPGSGLKPTDLVVWRRDKRG